MSEGLEDTTPSPAETVKLGGVDVPVAFQARWNELIGKNTALKAQLLEAQAAPADGGPALLEAQARIQELEATVARSEHSRALAADGVDGDDDLYEYLQFQYGKVQAPEGEERPSFVDWYTGAKGTNRVLQSALQAAGKGAPAAPPKAAAPKPQPPKVAPERKPASTDNTFSAETIGSLDLATWKANKEAIRKSLFGS